MRNLSRWLIALAIAVGATFTIATGVIAQDATPAGQATPVGVTLPAGCTVLADGLINPRYVAVAADGTVYVTEAGTGGEETVGESGPGEEGGGPLTRGTTGQVTAVSPDGTQSVVASGLPSYSAGSGPGGIVLGEGVLWITIGGAAVISNIEPLENENSILQIDVATGEVTQIAELGTFEVENNPDGTDLNPNLYGMDIGADGQLYVADAGGNTVFRVDPASSPYWALSRIRLCRSRKPPRLRKRRMSSRHRRLPLRSRVRRSRCRPASMSARMATSTSSRLARSFLVRPKC
jgi:hypothetical protein